MSDNKCWQCQNLHKSIYMQLEDETLYNCWCDIGDVHNEEDCEHFKQIED